MPAIAGAVAGSVVVIGVVVAVLARTMIRRSRRNGVAMLKGVETPKSTGQPVLLTENPIRRKD